MNRPEWSRDPVVPSLALFGALVAGGFVAIGLGWRVAARTLYVGYQVPALVSGAMGGFALIALGAGLATIQAERRFAAQERADTEDVLDEAAALVEALKGRRT
jgi:hypothetical protein